MADETVLEPAPTEVAAPTETTAEVVDKTQVRDEKGKFSKPPEERIGEVTRKWREQERETEYWKGRASAKEAVPVAKSEKPTPDKFDDYGAYVEALTDWKANEIVDTKLDARDKTSEQKRAVTERQTKFRERLNATAKDIPDYNQVMEGATDIRALDHVIELIEESDLGARLLYHFAKNPDVLDRLNQLPEKAAAREMGRIESQLESEAKATQPEIEGEVTTEPEVKVTPKKTTTAPAPAKPIGSGRSTAVNLANASMDEFKAARKQQGARWAR